MNVLVEHFVVLFGLKFSRLLYTKYFWIRDRPETVNGSLAHLHHASFPITSYNPLQNSLGILRRDLLDAKVQADVADPPRGVGAQAPIGDSGRAAQTLHSVPKDSTSSAFLGV